MTRIHHRQKINIVFIGPEICSVQVLTHTAFGSFHLYIDGGMISLHLVKSTVPKYLVSSIFVFNSECLHVLVQTRFVFGNCVNDCQCCGNARG